MYQALSLAFKARRSDTLKPMKLCEQPPTCRKVQNKGHLAKARQILCYVDIWPARWDTPLYRHQIVEIKSFITSSEAGQRATTATVNSPKVNTPLTHLVVSLWTWIAEVFTLGMDQSICSSTDIGGPPFSYSMSWICIGEVLKHRV